MHSGLSTFLLLLLAAPSLARADAGPSCEQSVRTASERLVFTAKDGRKYYLATEVRGAAAADPATLCVKSNAAPIEKKLCQKTFTAIRKTSQDYLRELGKLCLEISRRAPACTGANHQACAQRANQQGLAGQERMLGLLKKFETTKLDKALKEVEAEYKKLHEGLFRLFQQADKDNKLAELKASAEKPAPPPAKGNISARSVGSANLEQAWAQLAGKPLPGRASTISAPEGPLVKELQTVKALRDHLVKGFIEPETADRKKSTTELAALHRETGANSGRGSSLTGTNGRPSQPSPVTRPGAPSGDSFDQLTKLAQQGLGAAGSAMKAQPAGSSASQPVPAAQASLPPAGNPLPPSPSPSPAPVSNPAYRDVNVVSRTGGGTLVSSSSTSTPGASTGAIRRMPSGLQGVAGSSGRTGQAAGSDSPALSHDPLASAVKDAINSSQAMAGGGQGASTAAESTGRSTDPSKSGESLADLFARFDRAATKMKETFEKSPVEAIANLFSGGGAPNAPASSPTPAAPAVRPLEGARLTQAAKAPAASVKRAPASVAVADYFAEPGAEDLEASAEQAAGFTIEEESLFRRVHLKLQEKVAQVPVSQL